MDVVAIKVVILIYFVALLTGYIFGRMHEEKEDEEE